MSGVFVAAIGTDCGKTHVSAAVLRELTARRRPTLALKPLMSGYSPDALQSSDAGRLLLAMGKQVTEQTVADICWKSFTDWLAPNVAARRANVALDYGDLLSFVRGRLDTIKAASLVEGAGGVMSPLTDTHTNLDLAADLGLPVLLLATNYLGAVSHTLTALEVLAARKLEVGAIVVTQPLPQASAVEPLVDELSRWTDVQILKASYASTPTADEEIGRQLADRFFD